MERSRHYGDVKNWIEKVIDSCETYEQCRTARRLVWNFEKQMNRNKVDTSIRHSIGTYLRNLVNYKIEEIQSKYLAP